MRFIFSLGAFIFLSFLANAQNNLAYAVFQIHIDNIAFAIHVGLWRWYVFKYFKAVIGYYKRFYFVSLDFK